MADFNWINGVPAREWSIPDRGWSVLAIGRREFFRKSQLDRGDDAGMLFSAWAAQQVHRNYSLIRDELDESGGTVIIAMRGNPAAGSLRQRPARNKNTQWGRPKHQD